jgi:hypothetical protein
VGAPSRYPGTRSNVDHLQYLADATSIALSERELDDLLDGIDIEVDQAG